MKEGISIERPIILLNMLVNLEQADMCGLAPLLYTVYMDVNILH